MKKPKPKKSIKQKIKKGTIYSDKRYKRWRSRVFRRDRWTCRMCGHKGYIEAHHIYRKWDYPKLVFTVSNGVTLCKSCHASVTGQEMKFAKFFTKLIEMKPPVQEKKP